jgi:arginase family enzyme
LTSEEADRRPLDGLLSRDGGAVHVAEEPFERRAADLLHEAAPHGGEVPLASLVGVPFDTTTIRRRGSKQGPAGIRRALAALLPYHAGYDADLANSTGLVDSGDVQVLDTDVEATWTRISTVVRGLATQDPPLVILGGDHGLTFPAVRGLSEGREGSIALISLDAHFDVHRGHLDRILAETVHRASAADLVWLTLDIDVVDAAFAPGTNAPTVGGLSGHHFLEVVWELSKLPTLAGVDLVETSPPFDSGGITQCVAAHAVLTFLGARATTRASARAGRPSSGGQR